MTSSAAAVVTLGNFNVTIHGRPVDRWRAGKARNLFQCLLLQRDRTLSRETLAETLWPDGSWCSSSLKVAVHGLRRILDEHGSEVPGDPPPMVLRTCHAGYELTVTDAWIDFEEFESCVERAGAAHRQGRTAESLALYASAVELYRGEFLPGETAGALDVHREWLKGLALQALERLVEGALDATDYHEVMRLCRQILEIEPYREETYRMLMFVHARLGQLSLVRQWFELCVRKFDEGLQMTPDPVTAQLYDRAVRGDVTDDDAIVLRGA